MGLPQVVTKVAAWQQAALLASAAQEGPGGQALFETGKPQIGAAPFGVDPVLRAAALAVAMAPGQSEFGVMARIPQGGRLAARPGLRFGHAVREADGRILPPGSHPSAADTPLFVSLRIDLAPATVAAPERTMLDLLTRLGELAAEGWAMQVEQLAGSPFSASLAALPARPEDLPPLPGGGADGTGVLVGVVDFGCAFAHPAFRLGADGMGGTRLRLLWDQNGPTPPGASLPGRFLGPAEIDAFLARPDPYAAAGYHPWENGYEPERTGAPRTPASERERRARVHGTHVLSLAAGRRPGTGPWAELTPPGIAAGAALGFVHLRPRALVSEGDATDVFDGVCALFHQAAQAGMPAVVNLSIGANTGAHDGQGLMDRAFDALLRAPGRAITVAAGNMRGAGQHRSGAVRREDPITLAWRFAAGDRTPNILRLYAPMQEGMPALDIALAPPEGLAGPALEPGQLEDQSAIALRNPAGELVGTAACTTRPPSTEQPLQHMELRLAPSGAAETWIVTLSLKDSAQPAAIPFAAWIERDDLRPGSSSWFDPKSEGEEGGCSLGSLACAEGPICVGAYGLPAGRAAPFSSLGPTRTEAEKPDVAAPGVEIPGAAGTGGLLDSAGQTQRARVAMSGTSMAAPQVAGIVALLLQARPRLGAERLRAILRATTLERQADAAAAWRPDLGAGRVDAAAALALALKEPA